MHPLSISVTISNVHILFLKHFKVVTSLKSGDNFPQRLGPKWRRECLPYVTVLYLAAEKSDCLKLYLDLCLSLQSITKGIFFKKQNVIWYRLQ